MKRITFLWKTAMVAVLTLSGIQDSIAGEFTSLVNGNWNSSGTWTLSSGSDADNIPDADDNVTIGSSHIVTVSASTTVECNNLTVAGAATTSLAMEGANSIINIYGTLAATAAPTAGNYIDCTADASAKAVFKRTTTGAIISATGWGSYGEKVRIEVNVGSGIEAQVTPTIKFREIIVTSGTLNCTADVRPDEGTANTGKLTIQDGAILKCTVLKRTGTGNIPFNSLTINGNGKLIITGTAASPIPLVQSSFPVYTFSNDAVIEYQGSSSTISDITYPNLVINATTNGAAKSWSPAANTTSKNITVTRGILAFGNGVVCTVSGNILVEANGTISCGSSSNRFQASGAGRSFSVLGVARVTSNETQTAAATSPLAYQYNNFATYSFDAASWVSFRSPTSTPVTQGIDGITGVPFGNLEIVGNTNLTVPGTNTHKFVTNVEIAGHLAFPRATGATNTSLAINFQDKIIKVGKDIKLGGITADAIAGGRTYNIGTSTIELNGTAAQNSSLGGTDLPSSYYNLKINNTHSNGVQLGSAITVNGTTTISQKFTTTNTFTANGPVNVESTGIFQLNDGGWATGSGTWIYTSGGKLNFYTTSGYGVNNSDVFWPSTNSPSHVQIIQGGLTLNSCDRTVSTFFSTASGVTLNSSTLTLNGTCQINSGGYFNNAPTYGAASTLKYNTGGTFGRGTEWNNPANVQLSNNTTLNYPNTGNSGADAFSTNLSITGNLTLDAGSSLYMDYGGNGNKSGRLNVAGNVTLNGNLSLGDAVGGDLYVGGNWTHTTGTFQPNGREVRFNGSVDQSITNTNGETFAYLTIANTAGKVVTLNNNVTVTNNMLINAGSALTNVSAKTLAVTGDFTVASSSAGTATFKNSGTLTVSGTSKVQQYLTNQSWYLTSPVWDGINILNTVTPTNLSRIQGYNEGVGTGNDWSVSGTTMKPYKGYITTVSDNPKTVEFTGKINSGDISIPLTRQGAGTENKYGFNLIGNPYTAYLDWKLVSAANTSEMPTTTMWYRTKVSGSWAFSTVDGLGNKVPANVSDLIPPMQAFWVRASNVGNSTLDLTTTMVAHDNTSTNKLKAPAAPITERTKIRLQVSNGTNTDELLIYTDAQVTNSFDMYDSPKMSNNDPNIPEISTIVNGENLVINGLNDLALDTELPIHFMTKTANSFSLKSNELSSLPEGIRVILKDNGTEFDLTNGAAYNFTSDVADNMNRFSLIFRSPGVSTDLENNKLIKQAQVFVNAANQITIIAPEKSNYAIYNAMGQLIENGVINTKRETQNTKLKTGIYVVKVNNESTRVVIK